MRQALGIPRLIFLTVVYALILPANSAAVAGRPPIVGIAHVAFQVSDMAKARSYYGELLGYQEAFQLSKDDGTLLWTNFKVNDRQYIEIYPGLPPEKEDRLLHIALETTDLRGLRNYLEEKGVKVPARVEKGRAGNLVMSVRDPFGHPVEFVQYMPDSMHMKAVGRYLSAQRISDRILHVGLTVPDPAAADRFYQDILGFSEIWRGGATEGVLNWINMKVPEGTDYLEYMLVTGKVDRRRLGTLHHLALQVPDIQKALDTIRQRPAGRDPASVRAPQVGRNRRWQLNMFDPDGTRTELMEPFTMK